MKCVASMCNIALDKFYFGTETSYHITNLVLYLNASMERISLTFS